MYRGKISCYLHHGYMVIHYSTLSIFHSKLKKKEKKQETQDSFPQVILLSLAIHQPYHHH